MKKQSRLFPMAIGVIAMVLGTLMLPSCTKEVFSDWQDDDAIEMVINVGANTKTVNSGNSTLWADTDELTVIHSVPNGSDFWASKFSRNLSVVNAFTGKVSRLSTTNDWYVIYPYNEENKAANQLSFTLPDSQTQTGNASKAHFAGPGFPMFGKSLDVTKGTPLNVSMSNILAAADFKVVNTTASDIIVKEIQFTATSSVAGAFTMDITGESPVLTAGSGATKVVTLTVENGDKIKPNESSEFYIAVAPFDVPAGGSLKYKITAVHEGSDTPIVFYDTKTLTEGTTFTAGRIKTVNVNFDENHTTNPDVGSAGEVELEVGEQPEDGDYLLVYENGENSYAFAAFDEYKSQHYAIPVVVENGVVLPQDGVDLTRFAVNLENTGEEHPNDEGYNAYNVRNSKDKYVFYATAGGTYETADALHILDINEMEIQGNVYKYYHTFVQADDGVRIVCSIATGGNKYLFVYNEGFKYEEIEDGNENVQGTRLHLYQIGDATPSLPQTLEFDKETVEYDFDHPSDFPEPSLSGDYHTTVTYSSGNTSIAEVNSETGEVTIVGPGTTTITATAPAGIVDGVKYKVATASYTIKSSSNQGQKFYLTTELVNGETYVIVSSGKALANNSGSIGASEETFSGDEIVVNNASAMTWEATASGSGFTLLNNGKYLQRSSSTPSIGNKPSTDRYYIWKYGSSKLTMASGTAYSLYYSSGWKLSSSNAGSVSLYSSTKPLTPQNISFAEDSVIKIWGEDCNQGATFLVQTVSNAQTSVTYESSNSNVATISGTTITVVGKGSTTITATAKEENGFKKATATYSMHITDPAPAGFKHMGFFNLENDAVREYLDKAELEYTDDNITELSFVKTYYSKYYSSSNRTDIPKPVTISWDKASSGSAIIKIYLDTNKDLNLDSNEVVWTQTASSGSKLSYVYNLIPGKTYYCTVEDDSGNLLKGVFGTTGRRRMMRISDNSAAVSSANYGSNCRDLGGLKTTNGKRIKYGMIYRGTNLTSTSKEERAFMVNYMNIGLDNDLRSGSGGGSSRDDPFHSTSNGHVDYGADVVYCGPGYGGTGDLQDASKFKQTMKAFIDCAIKGKASYFHCYIGSDRTGYTGLMVEGLLGVTANDCSIDYEMTTFASNITGDRTRNGSKGGDSMYYFGSARTFLDGLSYNKQGNLTLQQKVINYLVTGLGIKQEEIDAFFDAVLEDDPDL